MFSKIGYSIVAASIFYFVSQYIGIYRPREKKKIKILPIIQRHIAAIDGILNDLQIKLGYDGENIKDNAYNFSLRTHWNGPIQ